MIVDEYSIYETLDFSIYYIRPTIFTQELTTSYLIDTKKARSNIVYFQLNQVQTFDSFI
jgi:hypothetical protein